MSKSKTAFGGTAPLPGLPYPKSEGNKNLNLEPIILFIVNRINFVKMLLNNEYYLKIK